MMAKNDAMNENRAALDEKVNDFDVDAMFEELYKYDTTGEKALEGWEGEGWYHIGYSDGGMRATSEGLISMANTDRTETHLPVVEFAGNGDDPEDI